ncbi:hypothetical protein E5D57_000040 [Metarhizium anisopliae]|nr:hypothetical protein E5D57_000040 [Metarhizium anisopliae]
MEAATRTLDIASLVDRLESEKEVFIAECEAEVKQYVSSQGSGCLAVNEITPQGPVRHPVLHVAVLVQFLRRKKWKGHHLESALSGPIAELVNQKYNAFIARQQPAILEGIQQELVRQIDVRLVFERAVAEELAKQGVKKGRNEIVQEVSKQIQHAMHSHVGQSTAAHAAAVGHHISATVTAAAATPIGHAILTSGITHQIAHQFTILLSNKLGAVLAKVVASAGFKKLMLAALKHSLATVVTAAVTKVAISHAGLTKASLVLKAVAIKILIWYIAYSIFTLPAKLGVALSGAVREQLEGNFRPWTKLTITSIVEGLGDPQVLMESIANEAIDAAGLAKGIDVLIKFPTSDYPAVKDNVSSSVGRLASLVEKGVESHSRS